MSSVEFFRGMGRGMLSVAAGLTAIGGFAADWNSTHLFNPKWTPHAKFHDALTITLGTFLGLGGLFFLWRKTQPSKGDVALAAALPGAFFASQAASFAFPGAAGLEAEFPDKVPKLGGKTLNELPFSLAMLALLAAGYVLSTGAVAPASERAKS